MVEVQVGARQSAGTVLASIEVANEDIVPTEAHSAQWHPLKRRQQDHPGHRHAATKRPEALASQLSVICPGLKVEGLILGVNCPGYAPVQQADSPANRGHMDGQKPLIEDKGPAIQGLSGARRRVHDPARLPACPQQSKLHKSRFYVDMARNSANFQGPSEP